MRKTEIPNQLAGDADELGSYVRCFRIRDRSRRREHQCQLDAIAIEKQAKLEMSRNLKGLAAPEEEEREQGGDFPRLNSFPDSDLFRGIQNSLSSCINFESFKPVEISSVELKMFRRAN